MGSNGRWVPQVLVLAGVVLALAGLVMDSAVAGKPSKPPPSGKTIYYTTGSAWKMASDGSGKTSLPGVVTLCVSDIRYDGSYYAAWFNGSQVLAAPVEESATPIVLWNDSSVHPWCKPSFRPGTTPCVTFVAVVGSGESATAGVYEIEFSADGTTIGDPVKILDSEVYLAGSETRPQVSHHDWFDERTIVYGDDTYSETYAGAATQLYLGDPADAKENHVALIASDQPRMGGHGVQFNSDGSCVIYGVTYGGAAGLYEISTAGDSSPSLWVASDSRAMVDDGIDYLDDDTVIYTLYDLKKHGMDIYKKVRGGSATNLTGDVSAMCILGAAR
jgi:hypothetical protein